jgi:hypothetical protein
MPSSLSKYSPLDAAWPGRSSSSVTVIAAMPAAQAIGFPPKVVECSTGFGTSTSQIAGVEMNADSGMTPAADGLAEAHDVRLDIPVIDTPEFPGPSHPGLNLIRNQQRAVAGAQLAGPGQVIVRRHHRAGFALHGFDDKGGDRRADGLRLRKFLLERAASP